MKAPGNGLLRRSSFAHQRNGNDKMSPAHLGIIVKAELQRAKHASEAPWVRKIGNPSSRENLVMRSPYERPSSAQTLAEGEGLLNIGLYRTLLKSVNIPIKYLVSHFLLPSPDRKVFRAHTKEKKYF